MAYEIGQRIRIPVTVRNEAGVPTDATMSVQVLRDDDTAYTGLSVTNDPDAVGSYWTDVTLDKSGTTRFIFTASGAVVGTYPGQFYVRTPGQRLLSLQEAKEHLNKRLDDTSDDDELLDWIDAITTVIEDRVGAVVPTTYIETFRGGTISKLFLSRKPVLEIVSIQETWPWGTPTTLTAMAWGGPYTDDQYTLDAATGVLTRYGSGVAGYWAPDIRVEYRAGRIPIPQHIRNAGKELLAHHWRASQIASGATRPRVEVPADTASIGIAIPNRVLVLLGARKAPRLGG